jgi:hypothetical protein
MTKLQPKKTMVMTAKAKSYLDCVLDSAPSGNILTSCFREFGSISR